MTVCCGDCAEKIDYDTSARSDVYGVLVPVCPDREACGRRAEARRVRTMLANETERPRRT